MNFGVIDEFDGLVVKASKNTVSEKTLYLEPYLFNFFIFEQYSKRINQLRLPEREFLYIRIMWNFDGERSPMEF